MVKADASQKRRAAKAVKRVITSGAQRRGSGVVATAEATRDFYNRSYLFTFEEVSAIHEALQAPPPGGQKGIRNTTWRPNQVKSTMPTQGATTIPNVGR